MPQPEQCEIEKQGPVYKCRVCGWWISAASVRALPLRRQCRGAAETKTHLRGLGDLIEVTASATGLAILARMYAQIRRAGCACQIRKDRLNKLLSFRRRNSH